MNNPLVSIIVRTKDRPKLLKRALQSIASQSYRPIEVMLVNDGGCDLDIEEIKTILGNVSLNYVRLEKNTGRAHAGNVGIENSKGEYVGFLDDDDEFYSSHITTLIGFLCKSDALIAYTDAYIVRNVPSKDGYQPASKEIVYSKEFDRDWLLFQNYIPLLCLMVKNALILKEKFDTSFDLFEDWDLLIRLSKHTAFHRIPEVTAEYHLRDDNTILNLNPNTFSHIEARYKIYRKHMSLLTEGAIRIFESLNAEREHYKELFKKKGQELADAVGYIREKEAELEKARTYINKKEIELEKAQVYIKKKEHELENAYTHVKDKQAELENLPDKADGPVSIVILTHNGEFYIKDLLDAIFCQDTDLEKEIIVIDSSSHDSTLKIVEGYNIKPHIIEKSSFSHPMTRNLGVSLSKGKYIVFVTQDALPANKSWLRELLKPFELSKTIAATYSRQIPRPDCNPLEAKDIYIGAPCIDEHRYADTSMEFQKNDYQSNIHRYIRFSNVSACYSVELLRKQPFDERLKMVEDQEWSKRMIEKGYSVYYASKSIVAHSHNFGITETYNRFFDYGESFKKFLSDNPPKRIQSIKSTIYDSMNDLFFILNSNITLKSKLKWSCLSPLMRFAANYGLYKGWTHG